MRKTHIILLIVSILFLSGCVKTEKISYLFVGQTDDWHAEVYFEATIKTFTEDGKLHIENEHTEVFSIWYTGDMEIAAGSYINYRIATTNGETIGYQELPSDFKISSSSSGNGAMIQEDEIITVTLTVNGQEVIIFLEAN